MTINKLFAGLGAIVALLPGVSQLLKLDILPDYWNSATIGIAASILCVIVVMVLYSNRTTYSSLPKKQAMSKTIIYFISFIVFIVALNILNRNYLITDPNFSPAKGQSNKVFIPIFLDAPLQEKINNPLIGGRSGWVEIDGKSNVDRQIISSQGGELDLNLTMIIFVIVYLGMFLFLICSLLILGFHLAPEIEVK